MGSAKFYAIDNSLLQKQTEVMPAAAEQRHGKSGLADFCIGSFVGPLIGSGSSKLLNRPLQPKTSTDNI